MMPIARNRNSRTKRRFPLTAVKTVIVALGACLVVLTGCLSGITPQISLQYMYVWMLGVTSDKARANAMLTNAVSCLSFGTAVLAHPLLGLKGGAFRPVSHPPGVLVLFIGSTVGAILVSGVARSITSMNVRRSFQFVGVCAGIYILMDANHFVASPHLQLSYVLLLALSLVSGALTQVTGLASGTVLVLLLYAVGRQPIVECIVESIMVIGLASVLPAISCWRKGLCDARYSLAGAIGGVVAATSMLAILPGLKERTLLLCFAFMTMFHAAREISKIVVSLPANSRVDLD